MFVVRCFFFFFCTPDRTPGDSFVFLRARGGTSRSTGVRCLLYANTAGGRGAALVANPYIYIYMSIHKYIYIYYVCMYGIMYTYAYLYVCVCVCVYTASASNFVISAYPVNSSFDLKTTRTRRSSPAKTNYLSVIPLRRRRMCRSLR